MHLHFVLCEIYDVNIEISMKNAKIENTSFCIGLTVCFTCTLGFSLIIYADDLVIFAGIDVDIQVLQSTLPLS